MKANTLPLHDLARHFRSGQVRVGDLVRQCQAHMDPELNAYRLWLPEFAECQAAAADAAFRCGADPGPLCGIPTSVKDIYGLSGFDIYAGSARPLPEEWAREGPLVSNLRAQLAVFMGKTHTVEFAFSGLGTNPHWGMPINPHRREERRIPGGSSSGAGISIHEGSALLALGSDTAGSVRVPASMVGVAGLKTTRGVWSTEGIVPLSHSLDTAGVLARDAFDLAFAFAAIQGWELPRAMDVSGLTIAVPRQVFWDDCDAGITETVTRALARLESAGARLLDMDLPEAPRAWDLFLRGGVVGAELEHLLISKLPDWMPTLDPNVRVRIEAVRELSAHEYIDRKQELRQLARAASERLLHIDLVATPTVAVTPPRKEEVADPEGARGLNLKILRNTVAANFLQLCAVTIPVGYDAVGMPVGLQLMASAFREKQLLAAAMGIEQALGAEDKR